MMAFRMRWALYAVLAVIPVIAALVGGMVASSKPVVYTAETRLAVGRADLIDAGAQAQAANFARFLAPQAVLKELPPGVVLGVSASPIPESNVIRVEARALDSANAVAAARIAGRSLQAKVTSLAGQSKVQETLAKLKLLNRQVATYQSQVNEAGGTGSDYVQAATQLASAQVQQQATSAVYQDQSKTALNSTLATVAPAAATGDNASSQKQIYMLAGLGGGGLVAYVIARIVGDLLPDRRGGRQGQAPREPKEPKAPEPRERESKRAREPQFAPEDYFPPEPKPRRVELPSEETRTLLAPVPPAHVPNQTAPRPDSVDLTDWAAVRSDPPPDRFSSEAPVMSDPDQEPVSAPVTITLKSHARSGAGTNARRGLNGLRQDSPTPRRTWP